MATDPSREEYAPVGVITSQAAIQEALSVHSQPGEWLHATMANT